MLPRLQMPARDNLFYIAKTEGGINPCVPRPAGSPLRFANCVFYALGRFAELWGYWLPSCNAEDIASHAAAAGLTVDSDPVPGALIVWRAGKLQQGSDGAGHVAAVEMVGDKSIVTSESGWHAKQEYWTTTRLPRDGWGAAAGTSFVGFVHPPDPLKKGCKGPQVSDLQRRLAAAGYLRASEVDGDFGRITLGAVLAYQFEHKLQVDGIAGPATRTTLAKEG